MSEMAEDFAALKKISQEKRAHNRENSAGRLTMAGIAFKSNSFGSHLIVTSTGGLIDFWPGTGLWITRAGVRGRGVRNLIKHIKGVLA